MVLILKPVATQFLYKCIVAYLVETRSWLKQGEQKQKYSPKFFNDVHKTRDSGRFEHMRFRNEILGELLNLQKPCYIQISSLG